MDARFLDQLRSKCFVSTMEVAAKTLVCPPGERHDSAYVIEEGYLKVFDITEDGANKTLVYLGPGDSFPLIWAFDHPKTTIYYYESMTFLRACKVPIAELKSKLDNDPDLSRDSLIMFVFLTWDLIERVKCLQMPFTYEKLIRTLPYIAAKLGTKKSGSIYSIPKYVTQDEIANLLGSTRESISVHLKKAREEGVVSSATPSEGSFLIDVSKVPPQFIHSHWFR